VIYLQSKLEKKFILEKRYGRDKKVLKMWLIISIINPIALIIFSIKKFLWRKYYEEISQMRDELRETELLHIVHTTNCKTHRYYYSYYALIDLGNQQIKEICVNKLLGIYNRKNRSDYTTNRAMEYGIILAHIINMEENYPEL
jgi:hypothetical protein